MPRINVIYKCIYISSAVHNEITLRSLESFMPENDMQQAYKNDMLDSAGFVQAGSFFPDWGYQCLGNNQQSEDAHWPTFVKTAVNYVREVYPIDQFHLDKHVKGLISFIFAIMSHGMADVKWHSLRGLSDYFIVAMAKSDFHNNGEEAHLAADAGGEFTLRHSNQLSYLNETWQVPIKDIIEIYRRLYTNTRKSSSRVPLESHLQYCMTTAFAASKIDVEFGRLMFGYYGSKSPFLIEELYDYYRGGIEDMSGSITDCYPQLINAFENGAIHDEPDTLCKSYFSTGFDAKCGRNAYSHQFTCLKHHPPFPIQSQNKASSLLHDFVYESYDSVTGILTITLDKRYTTTITRKGVTKPENDLQPIVETTEQIQKTQVTLPQQPRLQVPLGPKTIHLTRMNENAGYATTTTIENSQQCLSLDNDLLSGITLTLPMSSARLGHQVVMGDFNGNGQLDLAVSAPYYYNNRGRRLQTGAVFILNAVQQMLPNNNQHHEPYDIRNFTQTQLLEGEVNHGRFGWSMVSIDMNQDGMDDLAVSTPFLEEDGDKKGGRIEIYFGKAQVGLSSSKPDIRVSLSQESLLGTVLAGIDVDQDGFKDLVIGCPLCSVGNQPQVGNIYVIKSATGLHHSPVIVTHPDLFIDNPNAKEDPTGSAYDHFGESILAVKDTILIGAPGFSAAGKQRVGRVYAFDIKTRKLKWTLSGSREFQQYGKVLATDDKGDLIAISSPSEETSTGLRKFWQGGTVRIYDWNKVQANQDMNLIPPNFKMEHGMMAIIKGRTNAGHLGQSITFSRNDHDDMPTIWIGEPFSEQEKGRIYRWSVNNAHSYIDCIRNNRVILARFGSQIGPLGTNSICITSQRYGPDARYSGAITLLQFKASKIMK
ncbi:MAG: hypothetical protein EXX96DRAFT_548773 [Benjaminiella poitrasii]|nr:MAG: hypothetical protein EXX96DRAFT_548773 [Benjaminiella poitrasii]